MSKGKGRELIRPTGVARTFGKDEIIVSKTDTRGIITYGNDIFINISGYEKEEIIGKPHNWVRHPEMPKCIFALLWERVTEGKEIFAYVNNLAKNGDHYWVFAHVTPTFSGNKQVVGFHSSRRVPEPSAMEVIEPLYTALLEEEKKHATTPQKVAASKALLHDILNEKGLSYDEFIFSI